MPTARWIFTDPVLSTSYSFEINPNDGGSLSFNKSITYQNTAGPNGTTLVFEGRDETQQFEISGTLLSQAQHDAFVLWFKKRRQIQLTDDFGDQYWVYITSYVPKRVRAVTHPKKRTYTMKITVLDVV